MSVLRPCGAGTAYSLAMEFDLGAAQDTMTCTMIDGALPLEPSRLACATGTACNGHSLQGALLATGILLLPGIAVAKHCCIAAMWLRGSVSSQAARCATS